MSLKIFETHSHYYDDSFLHDRDEVIERQFNYGVKKILNCAVDIDSCKKTIDIIDKYDFIYGACGIHPSYSKYYYKITYEDDLYKFNKHKKVLAIGEIGLDYYYDNIDKEIQKEVFRNQLKIAKDLDKPVIIHCRDAYADTLRIIKEFMPIRGVVHCFSGSLEIAIELIKLGFYLGISGISTFKNAVKIIEVIKEIPIEYLLTETDCPYLSPVPLRGKRNESINIEYIIKKIADVRNEDFYKIGDTLYKNALKFFSL
ncbi:Deoxyribonuclease [Candidatus Arthromitus sp. SFB-mouse-NL]|uniref:TatD family hydrolase n=1 Tax=Candidatus Arthromitus sp. SFB-mouse-NL TaxID=1508644 RepID=UPI000499E582|nr:TatD family hydrolase [Candidatus Arthromitus sp. SFB-mouse-NL]AID45497.1 Deoxyribonuclease [Candidatus Arthromitus sp. SFB-mouse-NL]